MKLSIYIIIIFSVICGSCAGPGNLADSRDNGLLKNIDQEFVDAASQYKSLMKDLPPGRFPRNYDPKKDSMETSNSGWWCSGFYPGSLLYLYEQTNDSILYNEAMRMLSLLEKEKNNTTTHDLGFMMFCSFGNALRISPKQDYHEILLASAKSLSTRFNPKVGCIKSWDGGPSEFLVIIDNMMNLELLFWATRFSGDSSFYNIAITHANTTLQNHFRPDNSSYHVLNYDAVTGEVKEKKTAQGYADSSAWARGQAWGLYGYIVTFRETGDEKYLSQAKRIADFLLNHLNLPLDKIPYWDFNDPAIPNALRDASAGAIMASALLELSSFVEKKDSLKYFSAAETMLQSLSAPDYKASAGTNGGFILQHSVGHLPQQSEVDVAISYADYYFIEALTRYKKMKQ